MLVKFEKIGFKRVGMWVEAEGERVWMKFVGNEKQTPEKLKADVKKDYKEGDKIEVNVAQDDEGIFNVSSIGVPEKANGGLSKTVEKTDVKSPVKNTLASRRANKTEVDKPAEKKTEAPVEKVTKPHVAPYTGKPKSSYGANPSIEKQCAMKCATEIVVARIKKHEIPDADISKAMDTYFDKAIDRIQNG